MPRFIYETTLTPADDGQAHRLRARLHRRQPVLRAGRDHRPGDHSGRSAPIHAARVGAGRAERAAAAARRRVARIHRRHRQLRRRPAQLATNVLRVGDPVKLTVTITNRGDGPARPPGRRRRRPRRATGRCSLQPTSPPRNRSAPPPSRRSPALPPQPGDLQGVVTFNYTLIPLTEAARATPPIPFSYFDPKAGRYTDLTIPSVPVTVKPGAAPGDLASLAASRLAGGRAGKGACAQRPGRITRPDGRQPGAAATAGVVSAHSTRPRCRLLRARGAGTAAAVIWKQHPDVLLRRRARRALRRERRSLQRAARAADAPRFAAAAVSAMRVACAPHYPAEPRALVGGDVLPLLPEPDRSGRAGEVVRRFFAVTDAIAFRHRDRRTPPNCSPCSPTWSACSNNWRRDYEGSAPSPLAPRALGLRPSRFGLRLSAFGFLLASTPPWPPSPPPRTPCSGPASAPTVLRDYRAGRRGLSPIRHPPARLRHAAEPRQRRVATPPHRRGHPRLGTGPVAGPLQPVRAPEPPFRAQDRPTRSARTGVV